MVDEPYRLTIAFNCFSEIKKYSITLTMDENSNFESRDNLNVQQLREELEWLKLEQEDLKRKLKFQKRRHEELIALFQTDEEE